MKTEDLLNKYFDGETSCDEERELKRRFMEENIPEELEIYRPFFAYFDGETRKEKEALKTNTPKKTIYHYIVYTVSGIAASLLILLAGNGIYRQYLQQPANYVIIDGKRYTDSETIREQARIAFNDVRFTQEDIFDNLFE